MAENNEIIKSDKGELLNIFTDEEDKKGTDLLAMSDFFEVFIGKIEVEMGSDTAWEVLHNIEGFIGEIAAAIKGGFDISKMGMLVADYSHFSQDIIDGLKEGIYHVGQSREVAGNLRPVEDIGRDVKGMIDFTRREALSNKFIYARDKIMLAATASEEERDL